MKKRLLSILLTLCITIGTLSTVLPTAKASTNGYSQEAAVEWINNSVGTANDIDGAWGVQCVDLVNWYIRTLGHTLGSIGYAYNLYRYSDVQLNLPSWGWSRHYSSDLPQPGDIVVFDAGQFGALDTGHCGLILSVDINAGKYSFVDYNGMGHNEGGTVREKSLHDFSCVIRPDWASIGPPPSDPLCEFDAATGTLTISGTKAIEYIGATPRNDVKSIIIKYGIPSIGDSVFGGCTNLTSVVIPNSVSSIGDWAFDGCSNLTNIDIPNSVTRIGNGAFMFCTGLTNIIIPGSVSNIGENVFSGCDNLTSVTISSGINLIEKGTFSGCEKLSSVAISNSITSIGEDAFSGCKSLTSINIPNSVISIGKNAFNNCGLTDITIPNSVKNINEYAFSSCAGLTNITIPNNVTDVGTGAFAGCSNLTSAIIPATIRNTDIFDSNDGKITHIKFVGPGMMPDYTFNGTFENGSPWPYTLTSVELENGITHIGAYSFNGCQLKSIRIPNSVTSIGEDAFTGCRLLTSIIIPSSVTTIGQYAFDDCNSLTHITIPEGVTNIGPYAFHDCDNLESITLPKSLNVPLANVFTRCGKLTDVYYGGSEDEWKAIGEYYPDPYLDGVRIHFNSSGPSRRTYNRIIIRCPVDVDVYISNQLVGSVKNDVAEAKDATKIRISASNGEKEITLLSDDIYTLRLTATGEGTMTYTVQNIDANTDTVLEEQTFSNVLLSSGKLFTSEVKIENSIASDVEMNEIKLYVLDNNSPIKRVLSDGKGTEVPLGVQLITFDAKGGTVTTLTAQTGIDGKLSAIPTPVYSGYTFNGWYTAASGGTRITYDTKFDTDITIYAHWTRNSSNPNPGGTTTTPSTPGYNPGTPTSYTITAPIMANGTVTVSSKSASKGDVVTITVTPGAGYQLISLSVTDNLGKDVPLTNKGNGVYTFTMPGGRVSINAVFQPFEAAWNNPFTDVSANAWYYDAVKFVSENGLMNGVGDNAFSPEANLSRGMLAQILYNKEGRPVVTGSSDFPDIIPGTWYSDAATWSAEKGIVKGYDNGLFGPDDNITREQLAVMLWRYSGKPVPPNLLLNFVDADVISGFAQEALRWAVDEGIINGKGNNILDPGGYATRAEVAQMLRNYLGN